MFYIKNEKHGILPVNKLTQTQKAAGWVKYDMPIAVQEKSSASDTEIELNDMNKKELELYARNFDIELDRRMSKQNMIKDFLDQKAKK